jgi:hypothetical protein
MRIAAIALCGVLGIHAAAGAQDFNTPDVVQLEKAETSHDTDFLTVTMASTRNRYMLTCITKNAGCIIPAAHKNYLLFDKHARWMMPGAKEFITLKFVQDWTGTYSASDDNIGLVPEESGDPKDLGMFVLVSVKPR